MFVSCSKLALLVLYHTGRSVPQPSAGPMPESAFDDENVEGVHDTADHRLGSSHTVECLNRAIASIPSYIERSDLVLVLAPIVKHEEREDYTLNFSTWRSRGWCRYYI